ncbi:hypothetical protein V5799_017680 [Amblyomma americanum]|uniref:Uncharacterized protein n=1 Tax=Amblyomma americanum TaxID=6943 RepID=A0AAQ4F1H2_AMBAM
MLVHKSTLRCGSSCESTFREQTAFPRHDAKISAAVRALPTKVTLTMLGTQACQGKKREGEPRQVETKLEFRLQSCRQGVHVT